MKTLILILTVLILSSCNLTFLVVMKGDESDENKSQDKVLSAYEEDGMLYIPGGYFVMGSNKRKNEQPIRKVYVEGLYLDKTEVTVAEFRDFCIATKRKMPEQPDWNQENHPVVNVTWNEARAYAEWAGKRLPTEAEWEYVASGGSEDYEYVYQNSQMYGKNYENIADESMRRVKFQFPVVSGYDDGYVYTSPAGLFAPNKFGIYDLNGNVLEWCQDWYGDQYDSEQVKNPKGPSEGRYKVIRGASWNRSGTYMRTSYRTFYSMTVRFDFLGFRCARDANLPITQNTN
jgi:formylglycine-generating enzyme required for sulfatase activity